VRELINVVERAVLLSAGTSIGMSDLPRAISRSVEDGAGMREPDETDPSGAIDWLGRPMRDARRQVTGLFERRYLEHVLRASGERIGEAARRAGINERSLYDLMKRNRLRKEDFRPGR
jgi:two-component system response regulator AtoC